MVIAESKYLEILLILFEFNVNNFIKTDTKKIIIIIKNNLTKTIAQINDCLFVYMKFKPIDHALQHVPHFVRLKEWFVCACGVLH